MTDPSEPRSQSVRVAPVALDAFCRACLAAAGADDATVDAATRAMMHGSRHGIDTHGVRLLDHYVWALARGRVNPRPNPCFEREMGASAVLDADDGHGALAAYAAIERAVALARRYGVGAVAIRNSSHFGPAGAFALAAAEADCLGLCVCNADAFVRLHEGREAVHGTNPIAFAAPVPGARPWLLDMATSAVPVGRVELYRDLGQALPEGVASDAAGRDVTDAGQVATLAPLGGAFGYKGAGLAGLAEILSAALTGMGLGFELAPMAADDLSLPRGLGAFVLAIDPGAFIDRPAFDAAMTRYLERLRASAAMPGASVLAPGDREWAEERRRSGGIPLDPSTVAELRGLAERTGVPFPKPVPESGSGI